MTDAPRERIPVPTEAEHVHHRVGRVATLLRLVTTLAIYLKYRLFQLGQFLGIRRLACRIRGVPYEPIGKYGWMRRSFEELGPTYIKFGQMVASSEGLFPAAMSEEFRRCLDSVPPYDAAEARRIIESELGGSIESVFRSFENAPMAAASIAQVHAAELESGAKVVVKVQRPNLEKRTGCDVRIMLGFASLAERFSRRARLGNTYGIVADFAATLTEEMDFRLEAQNMDDFNALMDTVTWTGPGVCAPRVHWEHTTRRVLVMERFFGFKIDDFEKGLVQDDHEEILLRGVLAWFRSIAEGGLFHGDVHAGNLLFLNDGRVGFLDFGIVGRFDETKLEWVMGYFMHMMTQDFVRLSELIIEMVEPVDASKIDRNKLAVDLQRAYQPLVNSTMAELDYQALLPEIMRASLEHGLKFPSEFILITKQLLYFDRYARMLAPDLNLFQDPRIFGLLARSFPHLAGQAMIAMQQGAQR